MSLLTASVSAGVRLDPTSVMLGGSDGPHSLHWLSDPLLVLLSHHPRAFHTLTSLGPCLLLLASYLLAAPRFRSVRQKSYVQSCVAAGVMTVCGAWWVGKWWRGAGQEGLGGLSGVVWQDDVDRDVAVVKGAFGAFGIGNLSSASSPSWHSFSPPLGSTPPTVLPDGTASEAARLRLLALLGTRFFKAYLAMDLGVGWIAYRREIGVLTGWVHHVTYIVIMQYLEGTNFSGLFMLASILELPNFHLALGTLFPAVRHDATFLAMFFLIRIGFHAYLIGASALPLNRQLMGGSWVPLVLLVLAMPMHVLWFYSGLKGYLKRRERKKAAARQQVQQREAAEKVDAAAMSSGELAADDDDAATLASTSRTPDLIPSSPPHLPALTATSSTPSTPGLTPLLTPHTLLTGPNGLLAGVRDAFPFPDQDQVREGWQRLKAGVGNTRDEYAERMRRTRAWAGEKASDAAVGIPRLRLPRTVTARRRRLASGEPSESSDTDD